MPCPSNGACSAFFFTLALSVCRCTRLLPADLSLTVIPLRLQLDARSGAVAALVHSLTVGAGAASLRQQLAASQGLKSADLDSFDALQWEGEAGSEWQ